MYGAYGVLAALHERERTGTGTVVRTSLLASVVGVHAFQGTRWTVAGEVGRAQGNHHPSIAPYGLFHCRDGAVQIALGSEGLWKKFCAGFGLDPDAEGMATNGERVGRREQVIEVVEQAFADWDAEPLLARLAEVGVPAGKVRTLDEVYEWDQVASQGLLVDVEHPTLGGLTLPGPPLRFFDAEGTEVTRRDHVAPPLLDQHADDDPRLGRRGRVVTRRWTAHELLDLVLDEGTFASWDEPIDLSYADADYRAALEAAAAKAGTDESVLTGRGEVRGRPVAVVVNEFRFLAGSIGRAAADRITAAVRRATAEGLPAAGQHRVGRHPHAGGHARLRADGRDLPRADGPPRRRPALPRPPAPPHDRRRVRLVGLARPRDRRGARRAGGLPRPQGLRRPQRAAVPTRASRSRRTSPPPVSSTGSWPPRTCPPWSTAPSRCWSTGPARAGCRCARSRPVGDHAAWDCVERTRRTDRVGVRDLLAHGATGTLQLRGTDEGERDSTVLVALTRLDDQPCVVIGQDRSRQVPGHAMGPGALREARRGMRLAQELGLPLVSVIDTPGAELSPEAEERAIAGEIARCIATLTTMTVPTVSVILGQGCGGGALAFLPARTVIATEHAWLSPLPPEGASLIVHGDTAHAAEMAARQRVRAADLLADGVVQHVVPEVDGESRSDLAVAVAAEVGARLRELTGRTPVAHAS